MNENMYDDLPCRELYALVALISKSEEIMANHILHQSQKYGCLDFTIVT